MKVLGNRLRYKQTIILFMITDVDWASAEYVYSKFTSKKHEAKNGEYFSYKTILYLRKNKQKWTEYTI